MMARSTTRSKQRPDTLMQDRISQVDKASCTARPDHTFGSLALVRHWPPVSLSPHGILGPNKAAPGQVEAMSDEPPQHKPNDARATASTVPLVLRILAIILRALFLGALIAIIARVSSPQSETIWTIHETPEDLTRLAIGFAACAWLVIHIFMLPNDAEGYRTWLYFDPSGVPLACGIALAKW